MAHIRYPQFTDASPSAETLPGVGVAPNSVTRRRYEQFSEVKSKVETLWSLGVAGAGGSGFQSAWAIGSNVILQPGVN